MSDLLPLPELLQTADEATHALLDTLLLKADTLIALLQEALATSYYMLIIAVLFFILWLLIGALKGIYNHLIQVWF